MQMTKLIKAIREKDIDRARSLITNGTDVNEADSRGGTALLFASAEGHTDIVKYLLEHGAKVNPPATLTPEEYEPDPILFFPMGYPDITRLLIEYGADINARDTMGYTVLASALDAECKDTAYVLLEHIPEMTDIDAKTNEGHTALMYAEMQGYTDIAGILRNAGAHYNQSELDAALINTCGMTHYMDMIRFLVKKGAHVNAQDEIGNTALIEAALTNQVNIVQYLIELGADMYIKNHHGTTALSVAQHYGHREIIDLLKKVGAKE